MMDDTTPTPGSLTWPGPTFIPMGDSGSMLNPERVEFLYTQIKQNMPLGEILALIEKLDITEFLNPPTLHAAACRSFEHLITASKEVLEAGAETGNQWLRLSLALTSAELASTLLSASVMPGDEARAHLNKSANWARQRMADKPWYGQETLEDSPGAMIRCAYIAAWDEAFTALEHTIKDLREDRGTLLAKLRQAEAMIADAREGWLRENDPQDGTDVVSPYDGFFYKNTPAAWDEKMPEMETPTLDRFEKFLRDRDGEGGVNIDAEDCQGMANEIRMLRLRAAGAILKTEGDKA